jgi:Zn-dependent M28 family amino/carboxypeptidase
LTTYRKTAVAAGVAAAMALAPATALAAPGGNGPGKADKGNSANNNTVRKITSAVSAEGIMEHLRALQEIADANGGNRASGTPGYDASADYAAAVFEAAGYEVTRQPFEFTTFAVDEELVFEQVAPAEGAGPLEGVLMSYAGDGDAEAPASLPTGSNLGCAPEDFGPANAGTIVLVSRGACSFQAKAENAAAADAAGVVIYNNSEDAQEPLNGTLSAGFDDEFVAVGTTRALGEELVSRVDDLVLRLSAQTTRTTAMTENVIAETPGGNKDNVVMVGAHLDSVAEGPGINDNGSGSGAVLELAQQLAKTNVTNTVRFALWGAEESGLLGATEYVFQTTQEEFDAIALYLNFDMIASPNYVRFVYDGDDSAQEGEGPGPEGSDAIEDAFLNWFGSQGLATDPTDFDGRSDYGPFIDNGIPSGGLFTGAEGLKSAEQAEVYGGIAGAAYDPCYHAVCDTLEQDFSSDPEAAALYAALGAEYPMIGNINLQALEEMADAMAAVTLGFAYDTSAVNGVVGKPGKSKGLTKTGGSGTGTTSGTTGTGSGGLHDGHDHDRVAA